MCYWFEKARTAIEKSSLGAAVRVSLVAFGNSEQTPKLDGQTVSDVAADLAALDNASGSDMTHAKKACCKR